MALGMAQKGKGAGRIPPDNTGQSAGYRGSQRAPVASPAPCDLDGKAVKSRTMEKGITAEKPTKILLHLLHGLLHLLLVNILSVFGFVCLFQFLARFPPTD